MSNLKKDPSEQTVRVPWHSKNHPLIPKLYVQPWKQDITNSRIIQHNAKKGGVPNYEHDDNLFLNNREQLTYNVENRQRVDHRYQLPSRAHMMEPALHERTRRYNSHMLARLPNEYPKELLDALKN